MSRTCWMHPKYGFSHDAGEQRLRVLTRNELCKLFVDIGDDAGMREQRVEDDGWRVGSERGRCGGGCTTPPPPSGGAVLTVSGLRFGASDFTASVSLDVDCSTASWTSSTTICCATGVSLSGASVVAKLTVSSVVSSAAGLSTFDGTSSIRQRLLLP